MITGVPSQTNSGNTNQQSAVSRMLPVDTPVKATVVDTKPSPQANGDQRVTLQIGNQQLVVDSKQAANKGAQLQVTRDASGAIKLQSATTNEAPKTPAKIVANDSLTKSLETVQLKPVNSNQTNSSQRTEQGTVINSRPLSQPTTSQPNNSQQSARTEAQPQNSSRGNALLQLTNQLSGSSPSSTATSSQQNQQSSSLSGQIITNPSASATLNGNAQQPQPSLSQTLQATAQALTQQAAPQAQPQQAAPQAQPQQAAPQAQPQQAAPQAQPQQAAPQAQPQQAAPQAQPQQAAPQAQPQQAAPQAQPQQAAPQAQPQQAAPQAQPQQTAPQAQPQQAAPQAQPQQAAPQAQPQQAAPQAQPQQAAPQAQPQQAAPQAQPQQAAPQAQPQQAAPQAQPQQAAPQAQPQQAAPQAQPQQAAPQAQPQQAAPQAQPQQAAPQAQPQQAAPQAQPQQAAPQAQPQQAAPQAQPQQAAPQAQPQQAAPQAQPQQAAPQAQPQQAAPQAQPQQAAPQAQPQQAAPQAQPQQAAPQAQPQQAAPQAQPQQAAPQAQPQQAAPQAQPQQAAPQAQPQQAVPQAQPQQATPHAQPQQTAPQAQPQQAAPQPRSDNSTHQITVKLASGSHSQFLSPKPLAVGTNLLLQTSQNGDVTAKALPSNQQQALSTQQQQLLQTKLRETLPVQTPTADAFSQLQQLTTNMAANQNAQLNSAVKSLLNLFGFKPGAANNSETVKRNVIFGGRQTEANMKSSQTLPMQDMKIALKQMRKLSEQLPAQAREQLDGLLQKLQARQTTQQITALQQWKETPDGGQERVLQTDIPVKQGEHFENVELLIKEERKPDSDGSMTSQWRVQLQFDLEKKGRIMAELTLQPDEQLSGNFWVEQRETAAELRNKLSNFIEQLSESGIVVDELHCRLGKPSAGKETIAKQLIDLKT